MDRLDAQLLLHHLDVIRLRLYADERLLHLDDRDHRDLHVLRHDSQRLRVVPLHQL